MSDYTAMVTYERVKCPECGMAYYRPIRQRNEENYICERCRDEEFAALLWERNEDTEEYKELNFGTD